MAPLGHNLAVSGEFTFVPAIPLPGIYPKDTLAKVLKMCTQ